MNLLEALKDAVEKAALEKLDVNGAAIKATKQTAKELTPLYHENVVKAAAMQYYEDYKPRIYKRQYSLPDAFTSKVVADGKELEFKFKGTSNKISEHFSKSIHHQSGSKWVSRFTDSNFVYGGDNGVPENDWIFENFIEGVHPGYAKDGNDYGGTTADFYTNHDMYFEKFYSTVALHWINNLINNLKK